MSQLFSGQVIYLDNVLLYKTIIHSHEHINVFPLLDKPHKPPSILPPAPCNSYLFTTTNYLILQYKHALDMYPMMPTLLVLPACYDLHPTTMLLAMPPFHFTSTTHNTSSLLPCVNFTAFSLVAHSFILPSQTSHLNCC